MSNIPSWIQALFALFSIIGILIAFLRWFIKIQFRELADSLDARYVTRQDFKEFKEMQSNNHKDNLSLLKDLRDQLAIIMAYCPLWAAEQQRLRVKEDKERL